MAFLFVWQFVLSGPLEIASGYIGFAAVRELHLEGTDAAASRSRSSRVVGHRSTSRCCTGASTSIAKITISLWIGTLITVLAVIVTGAMHFDPHVAFDFPPGAFNFSLGFFLGLGAASRIGDLRLPRLLRRLLHRRRGARSGPRHSAVDPDQHGRRRGDLLRHQPVDHRRRAVARVRAGRRSTRSRTSSSRSSWRRSTARRSRRSSRCWCCGRRSDRCSRCCSATRAFRSRRRESGYFFRVFGRLHPTKGFPYVSLLVLGVHLDRRRLLLAGHGDRRADRARASSCSSWDRSSASCSCGECAGHAAAVPDVAVPVPALVALLGWIFVFATTDIRVIGFGLGDPCRSVSSAFWSGRAARVSGRSAPATSA